MVLRRHGSPGRCRAGDLDLAYPWDPDFWRRTPGSAEARKDTFTARRLAGTPSGETEQKLDGGHEYLLLFWGQPLGYDRLKPGLLDLAGLRQGLAALLR